MPSFSPVPRLSKSARRTFNQRKDWFVYLSSASWPNTSQARRDGNTEGSSLLTMFSACGRRTPISPRFHVGVAVRNKVSFPQQVREIACQVACFCKLPCHYHPGRHDVKQVVNSPGTESKAVLFSGNRPGHFAARKIFSIKWKIIIFLSPTVPSVTQFEKSISKKNHKELAIQ